MNTTLRNVLVILGFALLVYIFWFFRSIVAYVLIAGVISLVGRPVVDFLNSIHFRKLKFPRFLSALVTLALIWGLIVLFFAIFIPLISTQIDTLSKIDAKAVVSLAAEQLEKLEKLLRMVNRDLPPDMSVIDFAANRVREVLSISFIQDFMGSLFNILGNILVAAFSISFIAFFFLKDEGLFYESLMVLIPEKYEDKVQRALTSIKRLLIRYFVGIIIESTAVMVIVTIGMTIVGMSFQQSLVMGLIVGVLNVIPYVGPWIGGAIVMVMGIATSLTVGGQHEIGMLIVYMCIVIAVAQLIDNNILQPMIYSRSVSAHPLEVFVVILAAGSFAGIPGMILAIPAYTVLRVLAREFFYNFSTVKKITSGLDEEFKDERDDKVINDGE
ncbi:MAG TPA: AI-2E family transporter [Bacteroidales bacterium]|nr:AI-2E family transporter [Bacteroidales bacterium]